MCWCVCGKTRSYFSGCLHAVVNFNSPSSSFWPLELDDNDDDGQHSTDISNVQHSIYTVVRSRFVSQFLMAICWSDDLLRFGHMEMRKEKGRFVWVSARNCADVSPESTWTVSTAMATEKISKELNFNGTFHPIVCVFGHHCYRCQFTDCFPTRRAHFLLRFLAIVANGSKIKSILLQLWKNVEKSNEACREGEKMCSHLSASNRISSKGVRFVDNGRPNCAVKYSLYHSVCGWSLQEWRNLWLIRLDYIWFEVLTDVSNFVVEPLFLPIIIIIHYEKQNSFPIFFFFFQVSG